MYLSNKLYLILSYLILSYLILLWLVLKINPCTGMYNMDVLCTRWWENLYYGWYTRSTIVLVYNEYMYCVLGGGKTYTIVGTQDQPLYWYNMDVLCTRWWENLYYGWYTRSTIVLVCIIWMYCVLGIGKTYTMVGTQDQLLY